MQVRKSLLRLLALILIVTIGCRQQAAPTIDDALVQVERLGEPDFDPLRKSERGYLDAYRAKQHALYRQKTQILLRACRAYPDDERVAQLLNRRWELLCWNQDPQLIAAEVLEDIDTVLRAADPPQTHQDAAFWRAKLRAAQNQDDPKATFPEIQHFVQKYPTDARGEELLTMMAENPALAAIDRVSAYRHIAELFPSSYTAQFADGLIRQIENVDAPFELSFQDISSGAEVSIAELRGQVVVIDFWSTTCGPCIAQLPKLKEIYARVHEKGVEFIGVSLDEPEEKGGRQAVLDFIAKHDIPWPQFYQGEGYESNFSGHWGVGSIPVIFVIDREGRLRSVDAHHNLDETIRRLL